MINQVTFEKLRVLLFLASDEFYKRYCPINILGIFVSNDFQIYKEMPSTICNL